MGIMQWFVEYLRAKEEIRAVQVKDTWADDIARDLLLEVITLIPIVLFLWYFHRPVQNLYHFVTVKVSHRAKEIRVITDEDSCREACALIKEHCKDLSAVGFDCEWLSSAPPRPISLLQLSTVHGLCCLFRLQLINKIPDELQWILNNCNIIKLGISPEDDAKRLIDDHNLQVFSTLDLRHLYPSGGGLGSMSKSVLGIELDKRPMIRGSNWEISTLTDAQIEYAASDAFVAIEIFKKWLLDRSDTKYAIFRVSYNELFNCDRRGEVYGSLGVPFQRSNFKTITCKSSPKNVDSILSNIKTTHITRKTPLYHNCFMHAPDGELLCSCDKRKAAWYVERGLAEVLPGEPYSIKLLFEPAARATESNSGRYYQLLKQNCCVVCGAQESYLKHNVVPREYRKHFPSVMKNHQSHDVVLMCVQCHLLASQHANKLKHRLAEYCNAPVTTSKFSHSKTRQKVKNYAKALLTSGNQIPHKRKIFLENEVKNYYMVNRLTREILENAANLCPGSTNENYESHGLRVTKFFAKQYNGLIELEQIWRSYFLRKMKPQYLPALWSVNHNHLRLKSMESKELL